MNHRTIEDISLLRLPMKIYTLESRQNLPISLNQAWAFFSDPRNLSIITPPDLGFEITGSLPDKAYAGLIITYRVRPLADIPVTWMTEITRIEQPNLFVDEQRVGPYKLWHHQHHFRAIPGGIETYDLVHYIMPYGPLGRIIHALLVRGRLDEIFGYRRKILEQRFGAL